ncbi:citrulline utilization hydrolase CtlX [Rhizosphaericola mali]|uniref:Amidinotransferase n=1 Tax=Rhizosphaericola mali TaxID=2545455 RepID=A0A5P2G3T9_9BACT|nr:arginine deiminase-related protein [Rhizosphaericola mali]QES90504.1 amidinotransferase [Rhizosphaericola mali]
MKQNSNHIMMVRPASFGFNTETATNNAFQSQVDLSNDAVQAKALEEFDQFVEKLRANDINVLVIEDSKNPPKPDAIFPNNWFCTLDNDVVYLFPMFAPNRRIERRPEILEEIAQHFQIKETIDWSASENKNEFLEGTGSIIFDHENKLSYACLSERTDKSLLEKYCQSIQYQAIAFHSSDENNFPIYHTNVMLHIGKDYAVVCLESIKDEQEKAFLIQSFAKTNHQIIDITLAQVQAFAGNMLQVATNKGKLVTLMSQKSLDSLTSQQISDISTHSQILPISIPTIETIGGGSVRCMMAELFLTSK